MATYVPTKTLQEDWQDHDQGHAHQPHPGGAVRIEVTEHQPRRRS